MKRIFTTIFAIVLMSSISLLAQTTPDYLCFTANEDGSSVSFSILQEPTKVTLQYQINGTSDDGWDYFYDNYIVKKVDLNKGDKVYIRNASDEVTEFSNSGGYYQFSMTGSIAASGNVMSLVDKSCSATEIPNDGCFYSLFLNCTSLTSAPKLPATTLKKCCYFGMFAQCTSLTEAPELPATTLAEECYLEMFTSCSGLTGAPALPATELAGYCYYDMFSGCTSLTEVPAELPAMTLKESCYVSMFAGCSSLTEAPELPATTLASACYQNMFSECSGLTKAPELPATTLASACYQNMFSGCTSLTAAPALPATTLAGACYYGMFSGCTSLTAAPELPAETLASACYYNMFSGCTSLTEAPALPAMTLASACYTGMFSGCTSLTEAPALPATTLAPPTDEYSGGCYQNMFLGCASLTEAPALPATTLASVCYYNMFSGCTGLTAAPELPAETLAESCYEYMFSGCTSLTEAPALPAETLAGACYSGMFSGCTSLTEAPELPATTLAPPIYEYGAGCYQNMFSGCASLTEAPELPAETLVEGCYVNMFGAGWDSSEEKYIYCSKLNYVKVGFTDWNTDGSATLAEYVGGWLDGVSATGTFVCPIDLEQKTGQGYIPEGWTVKHPVKAHLDEETGTHYATFYSGAKAYKLENATAYAGGELDSSVGVGDEKVLALMPLTRVGDVIPKNVPVVLKSSQSEILISETSESGTTPATNSLTGTDSKIDAAGEGISALSLGQNGIGFYPWAGKSIGAHRAYYKTTPKQE